MEFRFATIADAPLLARLNHELIRDEGHRNPMSVVELEQRMTRWLEGEYQAVLFVRDGADVGYALYKREPEWVYLRQFFVCREHRRQGIGRRAMRWLLANAWRDASKVRVDALVGNVGAIEFWHAVDFADYCLTMEMER